MTIRSIILFAHLIGMLVLFAGFAVEWLCIERLRAPDEPGPAPMFILRTLGQLPRVGGIAGALIVLSGIALASRLGVGRAAFVAVSFAGIVLMTVLGRIALGPLLGAAKNFRQTGAGPVAELRQLASRPLLRASFRIRVWIALAIVYLMIAKPDLIECTVVLAIALVIAIVGNIGRGRSPATMSAREDDATHSARPIGGS